MASELKLLNVVAFNATDNAVIQPLKRWKVDYNERHANIELKCDGYVKKYDLRTQVIAVGAGEASKKVSIGKTLGRVALTGLLHGRHAATADLRWGGVDRDEYQQVFVVLDDTTTVSMEMDADEFDDFLELLPDAAKEDEAQTRAEKLMALIKAMVADGERVLDELKAKHLALESDREAQQQKIDGAETFDERHQARERGEQIVQQLADLSVTQRAVWYDFSVIRATKELKAQNDEKAVLAKNEKAMANKPVMAPTAQPQKPVPAPTPKPVSASPISKKSTSFMGKLVKFVVATLGAGAGFIFSFICALLLGPVAFWVILPFALIGGGWLGLKMLAALMRR